VTLSETMSYYRSVILGCAVVVPALAVASCGGSSRSRTASTATNPNEIKPALPNQKKIIQLPPKVTQATYSVPLTPYPKAAQNASGQAIITITPGSNEMCWKVSTLTGVSAPTQLRFFQNFPNASGSGGNMLADPYRALGCRRLREIVLREVQRRPETIDLSIHSAQYPEGAVRGPFIKTG
jgi:hypothetical protein